MKITCIVGSARKNGSTNHLIDSFINGVKVGNENAEIIKHSIADADIAYCLGCKKCYENGACVQNDDVFEIVTDIMTSDVVVMAAPSYWAGVPGKLKTLFDRTTPFGDTNPNRISAPKKDITGIAVAVRAGVRQAENDLILNSIEHYFGHLGIKTVEKLSILETDTLDDLIENHKKDIKIIYDIGRNIKEYTVGEMI